MRIRPLGIAPLIAVVLLAVALTSALAGSALARSTFQSSPVLPPDTPAVLLPGAPAAPSATPTEEVIDSLPVPSAPIATQLPSEPAVPPGFLPAPTLTSPDALAPGSSSAQSPLVGPAVSPADSATEPDAAGSEVPGVAQLIDNGIVAFSYVWLCCGALLLGALALVVVWLARRGARR